MSDFFNVNSLITRMGCLMKLNDNMGFYPIISAEVSEHETSQASDIVLRLDQNRFDMCSARRDNRLTSKESRQIDRRLFSFIHMMMI